MRLYKSKKDAVLVGPVAKRLGIHNETIKRWVRSKLVKGQLLLLLNRKTGKYELAMTGRSYDKFILEYNRRKRGRVSS